MSRPAILHCQTCGAGVEYRVPAGDNKARATCTACGAVRYENPLTVVGTVPVLGERVLLCRRAIEPRHGLWTLPAGFLELGESTRDGAARETVEEAGAQFEMGPLFTLLDVTRMGQVHVFYLATLLNDTLAPGPESLEARLFSEADIPWDELAFRTVSTTLRHFFDDRRRGAFDVHTGVIA